MASQANQREAVRLLAIQFGVREAARRLHLNEDTVCSWAKRGQWFTPKQKPPPQAIDTQALQAGDILLEELAENEKETKLSLSRSAKRMAKDAEQATLKHAPYVNQVAKTAALVHGWSEREGKEQFTLNVLNLNMIQDTSD